MHAAGRRASWSRTTPTSSAPGAGRSSRCSSSRATTSACSARRAATASCRRWPTAWASPRPLSVSSGPTATSTRRTPTSSSTTTVASCAGAASAPAATRRQERLRLRRPRHPPRSSRSMPAPARATPLDLTDQAVNACPVGAILKKRGAYRTPVGQRRSTARRSARGSRPRELTIDRGDQPHEQAQGRNLLARGLLRLPHVDPRHRRAHPGAGRTGRFPQEPDQRHQDTSPSAAALALSRAAAPTRRTSRAPRVPHPLRHPREHGRLRHHAAVSPPCATSSAWRSACARRTSRGRAFTTRPA
jgi:hypothetical protein